MKQEISNQKLALISVIRTNSRITLVDLSKKIGISIAYVHNLLKNLQQEKIIRCYCEPNYKKIGYPLRVCFIIRINRKNRKIDFLDDDNVNTKETTKDIIKEFIEGKNMINDCFRITGGEDYFIESLFTNMSEVYNFSDSLKENSIEIKEFHVVEILCKEKLIRETYLMNRS